MKLIIPSSFSRIKTSILATENPSTTFLLSYFIPLIRKLVESKIWNDSIVTSSDLAYSKSSLLTLAAGSTCASSTRLLRVLTTECLSVGTNFIPDAFKFSYTFDALLLF